jgi:hypothetical protein
MQWEKITDGSVGRPSRQIVLDAVGLKYLEPSIIHLNGNGRPNSRSGVNNTW